jgi:hypothetical protein
MAAAVAHTLTMIERSFVGLADAMPAGTYGFKPTSGEFGNARSFGEQVKHVACSNFAFFNEIEKKAPPSDCANGGPAPARTKAELMAYLRESFEYAQRVLRTMTPANVLEPARRVTVRVERGRPASRRGRRRRTARRVSRRDLRKGPQDEGDRPGQVRISR